MLCYDKCPEGTFQYQLNFTIFQTKFRDMIPEPNYSEDLSEMMSGNSRGWNVHSEISAVARQFAPHWACKCRGFYSAGL